MKPQSTANSNINIEFFAEGISINMLNNKVDMHLLRKSLRKMKNDFLSATVLTSDEAIEKFKCQEKKQLDLAIEKIQLSDKALLDLELMINPHLVFTQTTMPENGKIEVFNQQYNIILQPKFLALGRLVFIPIYLNRDKLNLLKIKDINTIFSGNLLVEKRLKKDASVDQSVIKTKVATLLRKFILYQFLILQDGSGIKQ